VGRELPVDARQRASDAALDDGAGPRLVADQLASLAHEAALPGQLAQHVLGQPLDVAVDTGPDRTDGQHLHVLRPERSAGGR
jgi:hypothetical protein